MWLNVYCAVLKKHREFDLLWRFEKARVQRLVKSGFLDVIRDCVEHQRKGGKRFRERKKALVEGSFRTEGKLDQPKLKWVSPS